MTNKPEVQKIYDDVKTIKNGFYNAKNETEWQTLKSQLTTTLDEAKKVLTPDFYEKYREGVVQSISKIYEYKKAHTFNKKQSVKTSYIFREDEGQAFIRLCNTISDVLQKKFGN